jgi:DNA-binding NarL/FixJ family response regulator
MGKDPKNVSSDSAHVSGVKILLVDDHELIRMGVKSILESFDSLAVCYEASDGQAAIELAAQYKPDLIVMDITLPVISGLEAARMIHRSSPRTPILMLSMHKHRGFIEAAKDVGAQGYVSKEDAESTLLRAVSSLLEHHSFFPG